MAKETATKTICSAAPFQLLVAKKPPIIGGVVHGSVTPVVNGTSSVNIER